MQRPDENLALGAAMLGLAIHFVLIPELGWTRGPRPFDFGWVVVCFWIALPVGLCTGAVRFTTGWRRIIAVIALAGSLFVPVGFAVFMVRFALR